MNRSFISVIAGGFGTASAAPKPAGDAAQPAGEVTPVSAHRDVRNCCAKPRA